eukprot:gene3309-6351_t
MGFLPSETIVVVRIQRTITILLAKTLPSLPNLLVLTFAPAALRPPTPDADDPPDHFFNCVSKHTTNHLPKNYPNHHPDLIPVNLLYHLPKRYQPAVARTRVKRVLMAAHPDLGPRKRA